MAFEAKTWVDRVSEYPTRRTLTKEDGSTEIVTVTREEGTVSQEGDAFNAENMNDLEARIKAITDDIYDYVGNSLNDVMVILKNCIKSDDVVGDGSHTSVASAGWIRNVESSIEKFQAAHTKDVNDLQNNINTNTTKINDNLEAILQNKSDMNASYAFKNIETFKKTDLTAEVSDSLEFGGATIGKNNTGMYMIIMFRQSSTYGKDTCSIWSALISSTPENSSAIRILGGGSTSEPSLKVTTGGNLRILGTGTAGATYRGLIFKM